MTRRPTWAELQDAISRASAAERRAEYYAIDDPETGNYIIATRDAERDAEDARRLMRLATMTDDELREVPEE